jgi:hypothetical protein
MEKLNKGNVCEVDVLNFAPTPKPLFDSFWFHDN